MNLNYQILSFVVMITVSFTVVAEQVYESVDKEGVVEFSDQPNSDAQVIDVEKPNVADSLPEESVKASTSASVTKTTTTTTTKTEQAPEQLEVIHQGVADDYDYVDGQERRREMLKERKERMEGHKGGVVRQPVHKGVHRR